MPTVFDISMSIILICNVVIILVWEVLWKEKYCPPLHQECIGVRYNCLRLTTTAGVHFLFLQIRVTSSRAELSKAIKKDIIARIFNNNSWSISFFAEVGAVAYSHY